MVSLVSESEMFFFLTTSVNTKIDICCFKNNFVVDFSEMELKYLRSFHIDEHRVLFALRRKMLKTKARNWSAFRQLSAMQMTQNKTSKMHFKSHVDMFNYRFIYCVSCLVAKKYFFIFHHQTLSEEFQIDFLRRCPDKLWFGAYKNAFTLMWNLIKF